uniref:C2H2-type domain-containing protein n=1 Tax=Peronospora matthiolae TaxID=2874970 RepID=A0AAV1USG6_9STRA
MDDRVKEAPYCLVCRCSSDGKWRKHLFTRKHQQATHQFLDRQANRVAALVGGDCALPVASWTAWRCVFCASSIRRGDALIHVGSHSHRKRVVDFCRQYRCDGDRKMRRKLWHQMTPQRREVEPKVCDTSKPDDHVQQEKKEQCQVEDTTSGRIAAFLSSATSRLQEVETERRRRNVDGSRAVPSLAASAAPAAHQKLHEVVSGPLEGAVVTRKL